MTLLYHSRLEDQGISLDLYTSEAGIVAIGLGPGGEEASERWLARAFPGVPVEPAGRRHRDPERQLREYLQGRRRDFNLPLDLRGSEFQKEVWRAVARIPYGRTASYGEIAHLLGRPRASRAVGAANGANPVPIVIPCHRMLGRNGALTGYGGGLPLKRRLLALEGSLPAPAVQIGLFQRISGG